MVSDADRWVVMLTDRVLVLTDCRNAERQVILIGSPVTEVVLLSDG